MFFELFQESPETHFIAQQLMTEAAWVWDVGPHEVTSSLEPVDDADS